MTEESKKRPPKIPKRKKSANSSSPKSTSSRSSSPTGRKKKKASVKTEPQIKVTTHACARHGKPFSYYDEQRDEVVCEDCGRGTPTSEAFRRKSGYFFNYLNSDLVVKRQQLDNQLQRVRRAVGELNITKQDIEREMKSEFSAMQERLHSVFGAREAVLSHDSAELKADIQRIQDLSAMVDRSGSNPLEFLKRSAEIRDTLEFALAKPFKTDVTVSAFDLPQELTEIRSKVSSAPALFALNTFKSDLVWRLKGSPAKLDIPDDELKSWAELVESYSRQLNRLRLHCRECGAVLSSATVNGVCGENRHFFS